MILDELKSLLNSLPEECGKMIVLRDDNSGMEKILTVRVENGIKELRNNTEFSAVVIGDH